MKTILVGINSFSFVGVLFIGYKTPFVHGSGQIFVLVNIRTDGWSLVYVRYDSLVFVWFEFNSIYQGMLINEC